MQGEAGAASSQDCGLWTSKHGLTSLGNWSSSSRVMQQVPADSCRAMFVPCDDASINYAQAMCIIIPHALYQQWATTCLRHDHQCRARLPSGPQQSRQSCHSRSVSQIRFHVEEPWVRTTRTCVRGSRLASWWLMAVCTMAITTSLTCKGLCRKDERRRIHVYKPRASAARGHAMQLSLDPTSAAALDAHFSVGEEPQNC